MRPSPLPHRACPRHPWRVLPCLRIRVAHRAHFGIRDRSSHRKTSSGGSSVIGAVGFGSPAAGGAASSPRRPAGTGVGSTGLDTSTPAAAWEFRPRVHSRECARQSVYCRVRAQHDPELHSPTHRRSRRGWSLRTAGQITSLAMLSPYADAFDIVQSPRIALRRGGGCPDYHLAGRAGQAPESPPIPPLAQARQAGRSDRRREVTAAQLAAVTRLAAGADISETTLTRPRDTLNVHAYAERGPTGKMLNWCWHVPNRAAADCDSCRSRRDQEGALLLPI